MTSILTIWEWDTPPRNPQFQMKHNKSMIISNAQGYLDMEQLRKARICPDSQPNHIYNDG